MSGPSRIVVLISGGGTNLQALIDAIELGKINGRIVRVISNKSSAFGLVRARRADIETEVLTFAPFREGPTPRLSYDSALSKLVSAAQPDLIVLAGFMRILSSSFIDKFPGIIINLHPALPGAYPGVNAIERAWNDHLDGHGSVTGVMVHEVIPEVDAGPVLGTIEVDMKQSNSLDEHAERMHAAEHQLLTQVVQHLCEPT